jgi:hypothetical protein
MRKTKSEDLSKILVSNVTFITPISNIMVGKKVVNK